MLVCHCFVIRARDVRRAIECGARSAHDVERLSGAGGGCGGCRPVIEELLCEHALREPAERAPGAAHATAGSTIGA